MKIRFYLAPQDGDGTMENPYRNIIFDYINKSAGEDIKHLMSPIRHYEVTSVIAEDATHAAIAANSRVTLLSRLYADKSELKADLDNPVSSFPQDFVNELNTKLEAGGVNTAWATGDTTLRQVLRYLICICIISRRCDFENVPGMISLMLQNLGTTVAQIPQATRQEIRDWMQSKGLAIGWITNQSTVREILHFIIMNIGIGPIKFDDEIF